MLSVEISVITVQICLSHFGQKKPSGGKQIWRPSFGNISLKCEVDSIMILPGKCPLTKLDESYSYNLTFSINNNNNNNDNNNNNNYYYYYYYNNVWREG